MTIYEVARQVNIFLPAFVGVFLGFRTYYSWCPVWIEHKRHVNHYRFLLVALLIFVVLTTFAAIWLESKNSEPGPISIIYSVLCITVMIECFFWPSNKVVHSHES